MEVKKTDLEIVHRMKQLEKQRPSVYTSSIVIGLLQLLSFLSGIGLLIYSAVLLANSPSTELLNNISASLFKEIEWTNIQLAMVCLISGILLLIINVLTRMINRRNAFLMDFIDILDPNEKP